MGEQMDRRRFLGEAAIGTGALLLGGIPVDPAMARRTRRRGLRLADEGRFSLGVAAGDPSPRTVRLWTRLEGIERDQLVRFEVARDRGFRHVVEHGTVKAAAARDFTAEQLVGGLSPHEDYYYRFATRAGSSRIGRFRTAPPPDSCEPVRIAIFTCQHWETGYYGAHRAIADEDVDLVLCLGDYIYDEFDPSAEDEGGPRRDTTGSNHDGDAQTLPEFREKYRLYKSDPDLQALHAAHPIAAIWDDHEVGGDHHREGTALGGGPPRAPWQQRRRDGYRAFYEYLPIGPVRDRPREGAGLYRRRSFGRTAELFLLDERRFRDPQPCDDVPIVPCPSAETGDRTLLGRRQLDWLKGALGNSRATWKLVGNQVPIMSQYLAPGTPLYKDQWDGYGQERRLLLGHVESRGIDNVSFITGDNHDFFAGDVGVNGRGPGSVATEFVVGSITSASDVDTLTTVAGGVQLPPAALGPAVKTVFQATNPHYRYVEVLTRGYGLLEARREELRVTYKAVRANPRSTETREIARFRVASRTPRVQLL